MRSLLTLTTSAAQPSKIPNCRSPFFLLHLNPSRNGLSTRSLPQIRSSNSHQPPFLSGSPTPQPYCCSGCVVARQTYDPTTMESMMRRRGARWRGVAARRSTGHGGSRPLWRPALVRIEIAWSYGNRREVRERSAGGEVQVIRCDHVFPSRFVFPCAPYRLCDHAAATGGLLAQPSGYSLTSLADLR
jgi:hypothetical protein